MQLTLPTPALAASIARVYPALSLLTLTSLASAQVPADPPLHFEQLALDLQTAFGNVEDYVEDAQTLPDFAIGFATGLAEASQSFTAARYAMLAEVDDPTDAGPTQLAALYELSSTGALYTAISVNAGDLVGAAATWAATREVITEAFEWMGSTYEIPELDAAIQDFLASLEGMQDSLELLSAPNEVLVAFDGYDDFLNADPTALAQAIVPLLSTLSPELLADIGWDTPEGIDELIALWTFLTGSIELDETVDLAQFNPIGWVADLTLVALSDDFITMSTASGSVAAALPDTTIIISFSYSESEECEDLCTDDSSCPVSRQYSLGTLHWGPGKFNKALKKAERVMGGAATGSGLVGGPGKLVKEILKGGKEGIKALRGLNKLISAARPVPYFRLCRPRCKTKFCPGTWWVQWARYKVCTGQKYTKWTRLTSPPPSGDLPGNPFAALGLWGDVNDINNNPDDYDDAVDKAADDMIDAAGGDHAFFDANS